MLRFGHGYHPQNANTSHSAEGMTSRSERSPAQKRPPGQFRVPDLRDPKVAADIRRQAKLMAQHPENDAIDDWLDAIRDPSDRSERSRLARSSRR
jgi:hypothetical protein